MRIDGLDLIEGSKIVNAVINSGASFPVAPHTPDLGEFFYKTDNLDSLGVPGLYIFDGLSWMKIINQESLDADPNSILFGTDYPTVGTLGRSIASGELFYKTVTDGNGDVGFYYWNGTSWVAIQSASVDASAISGVLSVSNIPNLDWSKITTGTPTTLNGYGITDAQPLDADLTAIAELTGSTGYLVKTAENTWQVQDLDADLSFIAALTGTEGLLRKTAADTWTLDTTDYTNASNLTSGIVSTSVLGTGTADSTTYLRGDNTWATVSGGSATSFLVKTANYNADISESIIADTSGGAFTITLPASPPTGNVITIADGANWAVNNLTVSRGVNTIEGLAQDLVLDTTSTIVTFVYDGTTWQFFTSSANPTIIDDTSTDVVQYIGMSRNSSGELTSSYVSTSKLYFNPNTGVLTSTDYNSLSDQTLKENVQSLSNSIDVLNQINPVSFNWKDSGKKSFGVIAQELEQVLPELIETSPEGIKSVSYTQLIAFLIDAVKTQQIEIEKLKGN
jgi:hypothetical protein